MKHNIDDLLDKYWDGETSLEDEKSLRQYFCSNDIDESHLAYRDLFDWATESATVTCPVTDDVDVILEKYWNGETSVQEENVLKAYFKSGKVSDNHIAFADLFSFFDEQAQITFDDSRSKDDKKESPKTGQIISIFYKKWGYAAAAASVLIIASVFVIKNFNTETTQPAYTSVHEIEDPEEALRVTKEALAMVSKKFRKSQESIKENMGALEKATIFK